MNEEETTRSESSVFAEFEKASKCIGIVTDPSSRLKDSNGALAELRGIFDKYLELPSLLDRHIETMVSELAVVARSIMEDFTVDKFWESPLPRIFSALYALSKVRGRKRIQKFLPHEVQDVEAVLDTLQALDKERSLSSPQENVSEANGGPQLWESIYSLWNWMGILSLVPFDCSVVVDSERISDLVQLAKSHLSEAGPTREIAAACLASWLSRPDLEQTELKNFREWSTDVLTEYSSRRRDIFRAMGILQTLVTILKVSTADRETVLKSMGSFWPTMLQISESEPSNLILRKYLVKWWTRLGSLYLPPRVALWRYKRGRRSLKENLIQSTTKNTLDIEATTRDTNNAKEEKLQCDEFFLVPDQVEEATGRLIAALTDPSTAVRWSAAKGIGRITERLPMVCAEDVLDALLELFEDIEKDNDWHGACLALAELARRGLLLPHRLQSVIPKIVEAMSVRKREGCYRKICVTNLARLILFSSFLV